MWEDFAPYRVKSVYLKLWYCPYIRVEYHRLQENNLARRRQLMCNIIHVGGGNFTTVLGVAYVG
jgi:hypothetical protein